MPILGIVASAGGTKGAFDSLASSVVNGASSVTFSSIPQGYQHLELRWSTTGTSNGSGLSLRFNNDSNNNYVRNVMYAVSGSSVSTVTGITAAPSSSSVYVTAWLDGLNDTWPDSVVLNIYEYSSSTKNKTVFGQLGQSRNGSRSEFNLTGGAWFNSSAITSLSLTPGSGTLTGTFSLYGIKG